jgi:hypothetical protein
MQTSAWKMILSGLLSTSTVALSVGACSAQVHGGSGGGGGGDATAGAGGSSAAGMTTGAGEWCGGMQCPGGQICCFTSGACFEPSDTSACPTAEGAYTTSDAGLPPNDGSPCNSDDDCVAGWICAGFGCLGPGQCEPPEGNTCGSSSGETICGCDGNTYPNIQSLCPLHLRLAGDGTCGHQRPGEPASHIVCGVDSNCPEGFQCCGLTDRCFDPTRPANCAVPPKGTRYSCTDDSDCPDSFCYAPTCGGPKGCYEGHPECTSLNAPVCGCDGVTYLNSGCALHHHTSVAHDFACH